MTIKKESNIISRVLSPAVKLWIRSQTEGVEELQIKITGGDRQILRGYISNVSLTSSHAVYQGLHLSQVKLFGENIRINLGQVIKGKALRLLEPIKVSGGVLLQETDLEASVGSTLLSNGLTDLLIIILQKEEVFEPNSFLKEYQLSWQKVNIDRDKLTCFGTIAYSDKTSSLIIRSGLSLVSAQKLRLYPLHIEGLPKHLQISFNEFEVDLGNSVELRELSLTPGKLSCSGGLTVLP